jgi:hypothetical protein
VPTLTRVADRFRIDLFAFALGALALLSLAFLETRNGAALVMCGLCFAGLVTARLAGFSNRALVPVAVGLLAILWMIWVDETFSGPQMSMVAHGLGGALIGWALSEYLRARLAWPQWGVVALVAVFSLTVLWEIGEFMGDRVLTTSLQADKTDSALDIFFGTFGGATTVALAWLLAPRTERR